MVAVCLLAVPILAAVPAAAEGTCLNAGPRGRTGLIEVMWEDDWDEVADLGVLVTQVTLPHWDGSHRDHADHPCNRHEVDGVFFVWLSCPWYGPEHFDHGIFGDDHGHHVCRADGVGSDPVDMYVY